MIIVGWDCGRKGASAWMDNDLVDVKPMPIISNEYHLTSMADRMKEAGHVIVEEPPKLLRIGGRTMSGSVWSLWQCFGAICMYARSNAIPLTVVKPIVWRRAMLPGTARGSYKDRKQASIKKAIELFPGQPLLATPKCKCPHDGMAEALLITEFCRRTLSGGNSQ